MLLLTDMGSEVPTKPEGATGIAGAGPAIDKELYDTSEHDNNLNHSYPTDTHYRCY